MGVKEHAASLLDPLSNRAYCRHKAALKGVALRDWGRVSGIASTGQDLIYLLCIHNKPTGLFNATI